MKEYIAIAVVVAALIVGVFFWDEAGVSAKQQEAGCTQFAKAGMWDIYECVDDNGNEFIANSAGMLISVGN